MTREQYDELSAPLVRVINDMEDDILRLIAAQLGRDGDFSDTSKWRMRQLARAGKLDKQAATLIAKYTGIQSDILAEAVEIAALTEIGYVDNAVADLQRQGFLAGVPDLPAEQSAMDAYKAFQAQAQSDLNLVNTVMQYKARSSFAAAVNAAYHESKKNRQAALDTMGKHSAAAVAGHMSLQEATRRCIHRLADKGIPAFVDKSGREWSPEAYVMMDMRSTLANTARAAQDMRCDEYGFKLIEVSSHMGARPLCAKFQGKIYSRDGSRGVTTDGAGGKIYYTPLSETSYGEPAGLFGINCGHVQYPFVPGCSFQRYFPYPEEENSARYRQFQQQRYLERRIRASKRECMMLNETGDKEGFAKASARLKNQRKQYADYCKDTGLKTHNDRTQVYGFDRSVSAKTTWAAKKAQKPLDKSGGNGIIKAGSENVALEYQRYGRNKDTLVNKTYVDSGEYRRKYDKLTDDPEVNKTLYDCAKAALKHRSGTEFEDMYWINTDTGKVVFSITDSTEKRAILYTDNIKKSIKDFKNAVTIHTHPSSMPPSISDLNSCFTNNYSVGFVACHDGKVFRYTSEEFVSESIYNLYVQRYINDGYDEYNSQLKALKRLSESFKIEVSEVI